MKSKNRGFSIIEVVVLTGIISILVALTFSFIGNKNRERTNEQQLTQPMSSTNKNIVLTEEGVIRRYNYFVFEDKATKTRIFYFDKSMVVIPKKEGM